LASVRTVTSAAAVAAAAPRWLDGSIAFEVDAASRRVTVDVHDLSGRLAARAFAGDLPAGKWQIAPFLGAGAGLAPGAYMARVRIGNAAYTLAIARMGGAALGWAGARPFTEAGNGTALRKAAAVTDTLEVVALGFERGARQVQAFAGTEDFKLNAVKYTNILYKSGTLNNAEKSACILDIHMPGKPTAKMPVVIHFHGGGMTGGDRNEAFGNDYAHFGDKFLAAGYIRDAAQAAIWARKNIEAYGGDPHSVFITGFSAGAYLTHMLAIDSTWWNEIKYDPKHFAGFVSLSGQTRQHANIQADLKVSNIMNEKPYAMAMGHIHKTTMPWQIFVGGNEGGTVTDNQALFDALKKAGSTDLYFDIIAGQPHTVGDMAAAVSPKRDKFFAFIEKYKGSGL
jgi:dienelactone hydrolase